MNGRATDDSEAAHIKPAEQNLPGPAVPFPGADDEEGRRPTSASSEGSDLSSGSSSGSTGSSGIPSSMLRRHRTRRTWRQSIQEQDDELEVPSVGDAVAKCKFLQGKVRELEANLLTVNTENTRLQNAYVQHNQTMSQNMEELHKLQDENKTLKIEVDIRSKENKAMKETSEETDVKLIKMSNDLLNAQTEAGKATRELEIAQRGSGDHSEYAATEERLLGTVVALKKELNLLREDVSNLTDEIQVKDSVVLDLERKLKEAEAANAKKIPDSGCDPKVEKLESQLRSLSLNLDECFAQTQIMKSISDYEPTVDPGWGGTSPEGKAQKLGGILRDLQSCMLEEVQFSRQLSVFTKECVFKLGTALQKEIPMDEVSDVGKALKVAIDTVESACEALHRSKKEKAGNKGEHDIKELDKLQRLIDRWTLNAEEIQRECSNRCFMTVMNDSNVPDTFAGKIDNLSEKLEYLPKTVVNAFDRVTEEFQKRIDSLRKSRDKSKMMKEQLVSLVKEMGISFDSADQDSLLNALTTAFKRTSQKDEIDHVFLTLAQRISSVQLDLGISFFKKFKSVKMVVGPPTLDERISNILEDIDVFATAIENQKSDVKKWQEKYKVKENEMEKMAVETELLSKKEPSKSSESDLEDLRKTVDHLTKEKELCESKLKELEASNTALKASAAPESQDQKNANGRFLDMHGMLVEGLRTIHAIVERKEELLESLTEFKVDFVASGLCDTDPDSGTKELEARLRTIADVTKEMNEKEALCMTLLNDMMSIHVSQMDEPNGEKTKSAEKENELFEEISELTAENNALNLALKAEEVGHVGSKGELAACQKMMEKQEHDLACLRDELHQDAQCQLDMREQIQNLRKELQCAKDRIVEVERENLSESLNKEIDEMRVKFELTNSENISFEAQVASLKAEITNLQVILESKSKEIEELVEKEGGEVIESVMNENTSLQSDITSLKAEISELQVTLASKSKDLEEVIAKEKALHDKTREKLETVKAENVSLMDEATLLKAEITNLQVILESKSKELEESVEKEGSCQDESGEVIESVKNENTSLQSDITSLKAEISELQVTLASKSNDLEEVIAKEKASHDETREKLETVKAENVYLMDEATSLKAEITNLQVILESKSKELKESVEKEGSCQDESGEVIESVKNENTSLQSDITSLKAEISELQVTLASKSNDLEEVITKEKASHDETREKLETVKAENVSLMDEATSLKAEITNLQVILESKSKELEESVEKEGSCQDESGEVIESVKNENTSLQSDITSLKAEISELQVTLASKSNDLEEVITKEKASHDETREKLETVKAENVSLMDEATSLKAEITNLQVILESNSKELEESVEKEGSCQDESGEVIESVKNENTSLQSDITSLKAEISELQETLASKSKDLEEIVEREGSSQSDLREKYEAVKTENDSRQTEITTLREEICVLKVSMESESANLVQELTERLNITETENNSLCTAHSEEMGLLKSEIERAENIITQLQAELASLKSENADLKVSQESTHLQETTQNGESSEVEIRVNLESTIATIKEELELIKAENTSLKAEAENKKGPIVNTREVGLVVKCDSLRTEVEQLTEKLLTKDMEVRQYCDQVQQHAITIVAIEERLHQIMLKNKEYRENIEKQNQEISTYRIALEDYEKKSIESVILVKGTKSQCTHQSQISTQNTSAPSQQAVVRLRRENVNLKTQNDQAQKTILALRRDLTGLAARLGDVAGEVDEAKKREIDEGRIRLSDTAGQLASQKAQVKGLFKIVDEKAAETRRLTADVKRLKEGVVKLKQMVSSRDEQITELQKKLDSQKTASDKEKADLEEQGRITKELAAQGALCRGERHAEVISNQRSALNELRTQVRGLEQWPRPAPSHEEALQQVMLLKKELAEIRARDSLSQTMLNATITTSATTVTENVFEKSAHIITIETLDLSENSYLGLLKSISTALDLEDQAGMRRLAHIPVDEQVRLYRERELTCGTVTSRVTRLRERLRRKEELLAGYEEDLARLHRLEELTGLHEQQVSDLTNEVRQRTEESECLRYTLDKARCRAEPNKRYVMAVQDKNSTETKFPALSTRHSHCIPPDTFTEQQVSSGKTREGAELMKKKNYEIKVLRSEVQRKDHQLDEYRKQIVTINSKQKTPTPPTGRPSSAKMRRARPSSAKRPASAKVQTTTSAGRQRSPSPPRSVRTPRELLEDNYQIISSTEEIRRSLEADGTQEKSASEILEESVTAAELTSAMTSALASAEASASTSALITETVTGQSGGYRELMSSSFLTETPAEGAGGSQSHSVRFSDL